MSVKTTMASTVVGFKFSPLGGYWQCSVKSLHNMHMGFREGLKCSTIMVIMLGMIYTQFYETIKNIANC